MPGGKKKGRGNGSPKKTDTKTRSQTKKDRQNELSNSLATLSSSPKVRNTKKSTKKQASLKSSEVTGITHQVVTVTKQAKSSEDSSSDNNSKQKSTGSDSNRSSVNQVGTTINLSNMANPRLDKQLDHVLEEFLLAIGANHEGRKMFKENDLYQFEDFVAYDMKSLE